jgi:hypothetical protein
MMATIITRICDACQHADPPQDVPGVTVEVSITGLCNGSIDLCERHVREIITPVVLAIREWSMTPVRSHKTAAATVATPSKKRAYRRPSGPADVACLCGVMSTSVEGVKQHIRVNHDMTVSDAFGYDCPLCGFHLKNNGSLTRHGVSGHDEPDVLALFSAAEAQGDPYGVVAARRAAFMSSSG